MLTEQNGVQVDKFYPPTDWQHSFPEGYTRLEYLESTGTQYIDTGVANNGYKSHTVIEFIKIENTYRQLTGNDVVGFWGLSTDGYFEIYQTSNLKAQLNTKYNVIFEVTSDENYSYRSLIVNEQTLFNNQQSASKPTGTSIYIFAIPNNTNLKMYAKVYSQQIWDNTGTLVCNFVPVKRNSDNKPGMYDLVNNVFYVNQGTGEFVMGPELYSNNSQIDIRQKNNTNFVEKYKFNENNELIWANPQLNLSGPVGYTKVGNPTIEDGVASNFSTSNYINISSSYSGNINSIEFVVKIVQVPTTISNNALIIRLNCGSNQQIYSCVKTNNQCSLQYKDLSGSTRYLNSNIVITNNTYYKFILNSTGAYIYYSSDSINWTQANKTTYKPNLSTIGAISNARIGYLSSTYNVFGGSIDFKGTYVKVNDKLWFYGKNYTSENYAPVPAGLNYNNTTTPSIGYVNMRTQVFTPAPTDGIKYSQTRDLKVIPPEDNTITLLYGTDPVHHLPSEYEELQALQSSGTQYILFIQNDEEINIKSWEIIAEFNSTYLSDDYNGLFGFQYMQNRYGIFSNNAYSNNVLIKTYNNTTTKQKLITTLSEPIIFKYNDNDMFNGSLKNTSVLFGRNNTGVFVGSTIKIGPVKLYDDNGTLIRNLIPARRKSDSVLGMVDIADENKTFYTNQGTGTFTAVELKYKLFGLLASVSSGTYDVYIDDVLYATTASATQTDIDFSALGPEYVPIGTCTTPESLVLHKIVIKPNTSGATITRFRCARTAGISTSQYQGTLWGHFELNNTIYTQDFFAQNYPYNWRNEQLYAVTAKNDYINNIGNSDNTKGGFTNCRYLKYVAKMKYAQKYQGYYNCNNIKRIICDNFETAGTYSFNGTYRLEQVTKKSGYINIENNQFNNTGLKLFPFKDISSGTDGTNFLLTDTKLYPTKLNITSKLTKLNTNGSSTYPMRGLRGLKVSNEAPFSSTSSSQINVSYTGLDRDALVELFNSLPDVSETTDGITRQINITAATGNNLTKVGTGVTIDENGVASGFSSANYLRITGELPNLLKDIEFITRISPNSPTANQYIFSWIVSGYQCGMYIYANRKIRVYFSRTGTTATELQVSSNYTLPNNEFTYLKIVKKANNSIYLYYSTDGINWILDNQSSNINAGIINITSYFRIGVSASYTPGNVFTGSIDLENTYIKVGNNYIMKGYLTDNDKAILTRKGWSLA